MTGLQQGIWHKAEVARDQRTHIGIEWCAAETPLEQFQIGLPSRSSVA